MSIEHANITDPNIHECKGFAAASANTVRVANGVGGASMLPYVRQVVVDAYISAIGTAGTYYVATPYAGTIDNIYCVHDLLTDTADTILSFQINGVAVTNGNITIANGTAAGTVTSSTPSANNSVTAGGKIAIITDGGTGASPNARISFAITRS